MQVSLETTSELERRLTIGVPAAEIDRAVGERLEKAARTVRLNGFRQGRVPLRVVRQRFGASIRQEVVGEAMSRSFYDAVTREGVRPAGPPRIDPVRDQPGEDLQYIAIFEIYPQVTLAELADFTVTRPVAEVSDADLDAMIERLRRQRATWEVVERAAITGDQVSVAYQGRRNGELFPGGSAEDALLVLGSGRMIPGFEDSVVGMRAGETKTAALRFPEDYNEESLRNAEVDFEIRVTAVREQKLPALDAEFLKQFGIDDGDMDRFRAEVRKNMERELIVALRSKVKNRVLNELLERHEVALPQALVANEIGIVRQQMVAQFGGGAQFDAAMLPDELFTEQARRRVKLGLIVAELIKAAQIRLDEERTRARIAEIAAGYEYPDEVVRYYLSNEDALNGVQGSVMEDQVVDHILAKAQVTDETLSYTAALQPDSAPDDAQAD
ncbi:MAG: trigger factor [Gammaproteobacteria bacterium]|nr:trigger factor [Gammaproteobacteria bacterium]